ncbi:MAG: hypothetical protein ACOX4F_02635 [Atopobiaceae bacterium]|jgi:malonyl CoA-acyl carrier protein transacylase
MSDQLVSALVSLGQTLSNAMDAVPGFVPCGHAFGELAAGICALDSADESQAIEAVRARAAHISDHRGVELGAETLEVSPHLAQKQQQLLAAIKRLGKPAYEAISAGAERDEVDVFLARACAALGHKDSEAELDELIATAATL